LGQALIAAFSHDVTRPFSPPPAEPQTSERLTTHSFRARLAANHGAKPQFPQSRSSALFALGELWDRCGSAVNFRSRHSTPKALTSSTWRVTIKKPKPSASLGGGFEARAE
jgi:hypothetical protein